MSDNIYTSNPEQLWRQIEQAGSIDAFVESELQRLGYVVERSETDGMSKRELAEYKKQLKREAAEKRKLKRDAWEAYRSKHIVFLGDETYWNDFDDFDRWDLDEPEKRAAENELPPIDSPQQLAELLGLSIPKLRSFAFHRQAANFLHYRRFVIPKRDGSDREIWAPSAELKETQRWILRNIVERLLVHGAAHGFLAGRSVASNAKVHGNSEIILKMDLKEFFPTVSVRRVKGLFRKAGYREQIATLLSQVCTEAPRQVVNRNGKEYFVALGPRCLPQGAPTSPGISNAICLRLDGRLTGLASGFGWRYSRYADDLTFSLPDGKKAKKDAKFLPALLGLVAKIVVEEGFVVNKKKTRILRKGACHRVTGLVTNAEHGVRVPRSVRRNLRAAIHNLRNGKPLRDGETIETLRGMAAWISMTDGALGQKFADELESLQVA